MSCHPDDLPRTAPLVVRCWSCGTKIETFFLFKRCPDCAETRDALVEEKAVGGAGVTFLTPPSPTAAWTELKSQRPLYLTDSILLS